MVAQNPEPNLDPVEFKDVFRTELGCIARRRELLQSRQPTPVDQDPAAMDLPAGAAAGRGRAAPSGSNLGRLAETGEFDARNPALDAVGLCLSGGGIRSASFCLGVLQALDRTGVLKRIDYLSTVSGGGYIGSSLSAGMTVGRGAFPFAGGAGQSDTDAVRHIRDYSNYLMPHGKTDVLESLVIYLRGLVTNVILVLPWLIFAAYITVRSNPTRAHLSIPDFFRIPVREYSPFNRLILPFNHFNLTVYFALLLLVLLAVWSLFRSRQSQVDQREVPSILTSVYGYAFVGLLVVAFFELQPFVLEKIWAHRVGLSADDLAETVTAWIQRASAILAPLAAVIAFFSRQLQAFTKRTLETPAKSSRIAGYLSKALLYVAAAAVPLVLWAVYFQLSWWGIADCAAGETCPFPQGLRWPVREGGEMVMKGHTPGWVVNVAGLWPFGGLPYPVATLYLTTFLALVFASMWLRPNANSLHRLYRDRLSKAFLFDPAVRQAPPSGWLRRAWTSLRITFLFEPRANPTPPDLEPLDGFRLTELDPAFAPYHLLNTALNIQGSKLVNQRGRNADFFVFSHAYVGSESTGYVRTAAMEAIVPGLDLGTALAISGAAASSNMGSQTIRPLTPTLALLNVRLGFWLRNPRFVRVTTLQSWKARLREFFSLYFLYELFANLRETSWNVYLTDGGHVENLGIYELLRRRCRVIIAVDGEADPEMTFGSFVTLQRYARIDLGVHIDLPWERIRAVTRQVSNEFAESGTAARFDGPHCAIGDIAYPDGGKGLIIYIKSSITGDENDYILDYKNRNPLFPHESTGDQFFTEAQFEAYRALGFHAAYGLFDRRASFAHLDPETHPCVERDLDVLDRLFPELSASDPCEPRKYRAFTDIPKAAVAPAA